MGVGTFRASKTARRAVGMPDCGFLVIGGVPGVPGVPTVPGTGTTAAHAPLTQDGLWVV